MTLRGAHAASARPRPRYFFSVSRGAAIKTFKLTPTALWAVAALALLTFLWAVAATAYVAFHDRLVIALIARQAGIEAAYEDRLAEARARLDQAVSRRYLDGQALEGRIRDLLSRQARLEQRGAVVAALAAETGAHAPSAAATLGVTALRSAPDALRAIEAISPQPPEAGDGAARAYAPALRLAAEPEAGKPHPIDDAGAPAPAPSLVGAKGIGHPDAAARLAAIDHSLDRIEGGQMSALAAIDRSATRLAARDAAIVAEAGLDPARFSDPHAQGGVGGPFIAAEVDPKAPGFDRAAARVAQDVSAAEQLSAAMLSVPLRMPLAGDASVTSPFGYRPDPFLGRLALHPGVDLAQGYGAEIHATGAGRVVHAGPMGGYGLMVEIDHGRGLTTRYGHLSETLVEEGQDVAQGALIGRVGSSGRSTGPHLHYEVRVDGEPVDPERYLRAGALLSEAE